MIELLEEQTPLSHLHPMHVISSLFTAWWCLPSTFSIFPQVLHHHSRIQTNGLLPVWTLCQNAYKRNLTTDLPQKNFCVYVFSMKCYSSSIHLCKMRKDQKYCCHYSPILPQLCKCNTDKNMELKIIYIQNKEVDSYIGKCLFYLEFYQRIAGGYLDDRCTELTMYLCKYWSLWREGWFQVHWMRCNSCE